ncbi:hypothetical protein SPIROBIBN47_150044 [uncultured spirochete]|uniref:Uncharacterized protein n=1 Tax=uncultured spirochete TaxID=156406 RepID=A0A3P3XHA0_9SPIR|nr:hypothetical protein SPIROBIBN47_150044 [uncultured spirochete]
MRVSLYFDKFERGSVIVPLKADAAAVAGETT